MQTFRDRGGVDEVARAQVAHDVLVQLLDLQLHLLLGTHTNTHTHTRLSEGNTGSSDQCQSTA